MRFQQVLLLLFNFELTFGIKHFELGERRSVVFRAQLMGNGTEISLGFGDKLSFVVHIRKTFFQDPDELWPPSSSPELAIITQVCLTLSSWCWLRVGGAL